MTIPAFRGYNGQSGSSTVVVPITTAAVGSAPSTGDIILLFIETANEAVTVSDAAGGTYTEVASSPQGTGTAGSTGAARLTIFWSRYNGSQTNPTVSDSGDHTQVAAVWYSGCVATGDPIHTSSGGTDTGPTTLTFTGVTTTAPDCLILLAVADDWDDASLTRYASWTNANLSSITERVDGGMITGNGGGLGLAEGGKATVGATGNSTVAQNSAILANGWLTIALAPVSTPPNEGAVTGAVDWVGAVDGVNGEAAPAVTLQGATRSNLRLV